jgi:hypothetical protein
MYPGLGNIYGRIDNPEGRWTVGIENVNQIHEQRTLEAGTSYKRQEKRNRIFQYILKTRISRLWLNPKEQKEAYYESR